MPEPLPPHDWHAPIIAGIVKAYARSRPTTYIEIGLDRGDTLRVVAPHADRTYAVDVTLSRMESVDLEGFRGEISFHEQKSDDFFRAYRGRRADVIFIDGDHSGPQVKLDLLNALGVLAPGGMVIVHDTFPVRQEWADSHCGDGWAVVEQMRQTSRTLAEEPLQVFTVPLFPGLTFVSSRPEAIPSG
jgi:hypothetical protein